MNQTNPFEAPAIYLDHAATSMPKPQVVLDAMRAYLNHASGSAGRGSYRMAVDLDRINFQARSNAAKLLGAVDPTRIVWGFNGTDVLNLALLGLLKEGDTVVTTVLEHNSVLRPLYHLSTTKNLKVEYLTPKTGGMVDTDEVRGAISLHNPRLFVISHASNVSGIVQPIEKIGEICEQAGVLLLVDAAQTAGHLPIDVLQMKIDLLATSGHKGLLGPLGTGLLYVKNGLEYELLPQRFGGTGIASEDVTQPLTMPERYESGSQNMLGIVGLNAAIEYLLKEDLGLRREKEEQLITVLLDGLAGIPELNIIEPDAPVCTRTGVVSFTHNHMDASTLGQILDASFGIAIRTGLHCSPRAHQYYGTFPLGGTCRVSVGESTSRDDIENFLDALRQIV